MSVILLDQITKSFPRAPGAVVDQVSFGVEKGEIFALLGESGSGKTTTLRMIAGLEVPTAGRIEIEGRIVSDRQTFVAPEKRGVRMVFQEGTLFPHLNICKNIAFGLSSGDRTARRRKVQQLLQLVGLSSLSDRFPHELSGGEKQRAELARALVSDPLLLLLDEPFSGLDKTIKTRVREEVAGILRQVGTTTILVTHDLDDTLCLSDRVAVFKAGRIEQIGSPEEVYRYPANSYVAALFGTTNLLPASPVEGGYQTPIGFLKCSHPGTPNQTRLLSIRPEAFSPAVDDACRISGRVEKITFIGKFREVVLRVEADPGKVFQLKVLLDPSQPIRPGDSLAVTPDPGALQPLPS